ncbi:MAG: hypothetical protein F6K42_13410 [Leptolyngbya sp. SIO1D8]|nr:hypothetical protein [Leptolyngbya sp. SIO1D8]
MSTPTLRLHSDLDVHKKLIFTLRDHGSNMGVFLFQECDYFPDLEYPKKSVEQIKKFIYAII